MGDKRELKKRLKKRFRQLKDQPDALAMLLGANRQPNEPEFVPIVHQVQVNVNVYLRVANYDVHPPQPQQLAAAQEQTGNQHTPHPARASA